MRRQILLLSILCVAGCGAKSLIPEANQDPIVRAASAGDLYQVEDVLRQQGRTVAADSDRSAFLAALRSDQYDVAAAMLQRFPEIGSRDALAIAAETGDRQIVTLLLHVAKHEPEALDDAMIAAARSGNPAVFDLLLKFGGRLDAQGSAGETPLIAAIQVGDVPMMKHLVALGASVDAPTRLGTPRQYAAKAVRIAPVVLEYLKTLS